MCLTVRRLYCAVLMMAVCFPSQHQKPESEEQRGGVKRYREDDRDWRQEGRDRGEGRSRDRADPTKAPDPEEPEGFNESEVSLMEEEFRPPDDDSVIVLDKCKGAVRRSSIVMDECRKWKF